MCGAESCSLAVKAEIYTCCPGRAAHQGGSAVGVWFGLSLDSRLTSINVAGAACFLLHVVCVRVSAEEMLQRQMVPCGGGGSLVKTHIRAVLMSETFNWQQNKQHYSTSVVTWEAPLIDAHHMMMLLLSTTTLQRLSSVFRKKNISFIYFLFYINSFSFYSFANLQKNVLRGVNVTVATWRMTAAAINLKQLEAASLMILAQKAQRPTTDTDFENMTESNIVFFFIVLASR